MQSPCPIESRPNILLVEDDDVVREALVDALQILGYHVYEAANGMEALALVERTPVAVDLVISDLVMPGMNALQLHEALGLERASGKMLILTGYPMPPAGASLVDKPDVQWAKKPISVEALNLLIEQMIGRNAGL